MLWRVLLTSFSSVPKIRNTSSSCPYFFEAIYLYVLLVPPLISLFPSAWSSFFCLGLKFTFLELLRGYSSHKSIWVNSSSSYLIHSWFYKLILSSVNLIFSSLLCLIAWQYSALAQHWHFIVSHWQCANATREQMKSPLEVPFGSQWIEKWSLGWV